jgi:hypothetical protein
MRGHCNQTSRVLLLGLLSVLCFLPAAWGQVDQGTVTGTVQDISGAVVLNAQVSLRNVETNFVLTTRTNGSGLYVFPPVKVGTYSVSANATGFETSVQENIHVDVQARLKIDLTLRPGANSETVQVTSAPPPLQTETSSVGQVLNTTTIDNTPLNGRNWVYIVQMSAGVVPSTGSKGAGTGDFSANGQRGDQNNFLMDGIDNNANILDLMNGASYNVRPPPDALSEFKVETTDYSAEYGHSAGAAVNVSLKSGTNEIHGALWEYVRNTALDAMNWNALVNPPYHENQFGGTLGFPILKNKLFFFADTEANRVDYASTGTYTVPTPLMRQGNFTEWLNTSLTGGSCPTILFQSNAVGGKYTCSGGKVTVLGGPLQQYGSSVTTANGYTYPTGQNVYNAATLDAAALKILNMYPLPNANGWNSGNNTNTSTAQGLTYNNLVENLKTNGDTFQWDSRLDWNIRPADQAFVRLSYSNYRGYVPGSLGPILDGNTSYSSGSIASLIENIAASETHIFSPTLFNEFRFGYNYGMYRFLQPGYNTSVASQLGLGGIPTGPMNGGLPLVAVGGITSFGTATYDPSIEGQNVYQLLDNVTKVVRNHSLKFGVSLESMRMSAIQPPKSRGSYSFNGFFTGSGGLSNSGSGVADFLNDQMASASVSSINYIADYAWYRGAYAQDDWKVSRKLTLNLGLRYDYFQPTNENGGNQANFVVNSVGIGTGTGTYLIPSAQQKFPIPAAFMTLLQQNNIALQYDSNPALVTAQHMNFAPRVGFAFSPDAKTVLTGGFGIFYGGVEEVGVGPNMGLNFPFYATASYSRPSCGTTTCPSLTAQGVTLEQGFTQALAVGLQNVFALPSFEGASPNQKVTNTQGYNLAVQRALTNTVIMSLGYVGNISRHLITNYGFDAAGALINPSNSATAYEPFPGLGGGTIMWNTGMSNYNGLQAKLDKRFSNGLNFLATYTWNHTLDDSYDPIAGGVSMRNVNLIPIHDEYTNSPYDVRQRVNFNGFYKLPFGKGQQFMNHGGILDAVLGRWSTDLAFFAQTGKPFGVSPTGVTTAGGGTSRAFLVGDAWAGGGTPDPSNPIAASACPTSVHNKTNWYNPCAFANPPAGSIIPKTGTGSEITGEQAAIQYLGGKTNILHGPGYQRVNMSLFKDFPVWREQLIEFRADCFNVLNEPSYSIGNSGDGPTAGQITGTQSFQSNTPDARFFQLSAKYKF